MKSGKQVFMKRGKFIHKMLQSAQERGFDAL